jgi:hypothetical protein
VILRVAESGRDARDELIDELDEWLSAVIVPAAEEEA